MSKQEWVLIETGVHKIPTCTKVQEMIRQTLPLECFFGLVRNSQKLLLTGSPFYGINYGGARPAIHKVE